MKYDVKLVVRSSSTFAETLQTYLNDKYELHGTPFLYSDGYVGQVVIKKIYPPNPPIPPKDWYPQ